MTGNYQPRHAAPGSMPDLLDISSRLNLLSDEAVRRIVSLIAMRDAAMLAALLDEDSWQVAR